MKAGNVLSVFGIGFTFGGILFGTAVKYCQNSSLIFEFIGIVGISFICMGYVYCYDYWMLAALSFLFGLFRSALSTLRPISLVHMFGIEYLNVAYAMVTFVGSLAAIFGPPIIGAFKYAIGSYAKVYLFIGGIFIVGAVSIFGVAWIDYRYKMRHSIL